MYFGNKNIPDSSYKLIYNMVLLKIAKQIDKHLHIHKISHCNMI